MFIDNRTPYAVRTMAVPCSATRTIAFATYRASYQLSASGLVPGEILPAQADRLSALPSCIGTSWSLTGTAEAPRATPELRAEVRVSSRPAVTLAVIGDRVWRRRGGALCPSDPAPFQRMSLGSERAFGGTVRIPPGERDGLPHPAMQVRHAANPRGRGYFLTAESAEGSPCPNLEFADSLLGPWPREPDPAVLAPDDSQLFTRLPEGGKQLETEPEIAAARVCHPGHWRTFGAPLRPGDPLAFIGFRRDALAFSLPSAPAQVELRQGRKWHPVGFHARHIYVALDQARIEIRFGHSASYSIDQPVTDMRIREKN